ncbi:hypothetical protein AX16_002858 [Volvariella volvacea WC 439]|nr:hypothetical protein AX16_002858 [Volvariella volvacea WC 439]
MGADSIPQSSNRWGPLYSLLVISPVLIAAPLFALRQHYALAEPLTELTNPITGLPQISEPRILNVAKVLSEDIGYRTVGTYEHALADSWMLEQAHNVQKHCERVVAENGRKLECEVWRQEGSGNHRFDMMGKRLYKTYRNLTNIVVRISDGTEQGKKHAVLVNAHLDSTLPSPGAADDAISVGVMVECMRVLVDTPGWEPRHAIVFLFNHAEESLQDGSHLFSTQHPVAPTVRAAINLEAAGSTGRELLFQATSEQMIQAYSRVPRPFGTIFANEIFSSGILLSDTDFRQFEYYLNVTGLDMAIVGNSYLYHMRKDLVENIQPGVGQNMAENALALLYHLSTSPDSPLPDLASRGYTRPTTVFFSYLGVFLIYSFETAQVLYTALLALSVGLVGVTATATADAGAGAGARAGSGGSVWDEQWRGAKAVGAAVVGSLVTPNLVAVVMSKVLGKGMSWFSDVYSPIALYAPPAILGALLSQYLVGPVQERTLFNSILLMQTAVTAGLQFIGIGSAAIFFLSSLPLFFVLVGNAVLSAPSTPSSSSASSSTKVNGVVNGNGKANGATANGKIVNGYNKNESENEWEREQMSLWNYSLGQFFPLFTGTLLIVPVLEVFVPLTGRIGADAPAETMICTIVAALGSQALPLLVPFAHRFGREALRRSVLLMSVVTVVMMAVFAARVPFDGMHQKRLFVLHLENVTTNEHHLHLSAADGAPGFEALVHDISKEFAASSDVEPSLAVMNDYNSDWDVLYPFSAFLTPYKVPLKAREEGYVSPWSVDGEKAFKISALNDVYDVANGTRSLTLKIDHPGLIWTTIAFDAHVLQWSLDDSPPQEHARHHIKEASFYGVDSYTIDLVIAASQNKEKLRVNFIGMEEQGMWPGKRSVLLEHRARDERERERQQSSGLGGVGPSIGTLTFFEKLDGWLEEKTEGTVDAMLIGCVGGVVDV